MRDFAAGSYWVSARLRGQSPIQDEEGVNFKHAWADPASGMVFCLSEAPSAEAVQRVHEPAGHATDQVYEVPVRA